MLQLIDDWCMRFVPKGLEDDDHRRARLIVYFSFFLAGTGFAYASFYMMLGMTWAAIGAFMASAMMPGTPFFLRATGRINASGHWVAFTAWFVLVEITWFTGALHAPGLGWFGVVPITALMLTGRVGGIVWTALSVGVTPAYFAIDLVVGSPANTTPAAWQDALTMVVLSGLIAVIGWLTSIYESNKDKMLAVVSDARDAASNAHAEARLVLDNVQEALMTFDLDGKRVGDASKAAHALFPNSQGDTVWEVFGDDNPTHGEWMQLGWEGLADGFLPVEVTLAQLPERYVGPEQVLSLRYVPIVDDNDAHAEVQRVMMVAADITDQVAAEAEQGRKQEQLEAFRWVMRDREFFESFLHEAKVRFDVVVDDTQTMTLRKRELHTLKGNAGLFGFKRLAAACHDLESALEETDADHISAEVLAPFTAQWDDLQELVEPLTGGGSNDDKTLVVQRDDHARLIDGLRDAVDHHVLLADVEKWLWIPTSLYLERLVEQTRALAVRLERQPPTFTVNDDGTLLPPQKWETFFSSAVHLVRNAMDHGLESPDERSSAGKDAYGHLKFAVQRLSDTIVVTVADDGRGIDWDKVRAKAETMGLDTDNLEAVLFADGMSTADEVSETSGRGVGMSAVLAAAEELGGRVEVNTTPGQGTQFSFVFPAQAAHVANDDDEGHVVRASQSA